MVLILNLYNVICLNNVTSVSYKTETWKIIANGVKSEIESKHMYV